MEQKLPRSFACSRLPWLVAAAMLLLYLITLNSHVSVTSVPSLVRWGGIDWRPVYVAPFTWLVSLPVRLLPISAQLVGLNLIGAVCAALTLALLARSIALLPHDRTHEQRLRQKGEKGLLSGPIAWIPPLFGVLLLGLQRTFWENAIVFTGEAVDMLLIAYVVRCLLEFRNDGRDPWLFKLALVYGIGIANNFALIPYAPVILAAVIWVKALRFFQAPFLLRFAAFGLAGLCLYLLLPIVQSLNDLATTSFIATLRINLGFQKQYILNIHRLFALWVGGFPLVLLLVASIRWPSGFGDSSRIGSIVGTAIVHLLHMGLLAFAIWMALDLTMSPRFLSVREPRVFGLAFLGSYYLTALAAGYFVGYLLLVFSDYSARSRRPQGTVMVPLSYVVTLLVCTTAIAAPLKLAIDNWPRVRVLNAPEFRDYAKQQLDSLPKQPTTVLADDTTRLYAVALLGGAKSGHVFIESTSLADPMYLKFLAKKYPGVIPKLPPEASKPPVPTSAFLNLLAALKQSRDLYYLNPSFGYFFETYYLEPQQLIYRLEVYPTNMIEAPVPTAAAITRQAEFWNRLSAPVLRPLAKKRAKAVADKISGYDVDITSRYYAQAMDFWGVELQRGGRFDEAVKYFDEALVVYPDSASAFINREANIEWRKEHKRLERISDEGMAKLKLQSGGVDGLLNHGGPVDEPSFRFEIAQYLAQNGLWRQASQNALRAISFAPDDVILQNALANIYLHSGQPDRTLAVVKQIRSGRTAATTPAPVAVDIVRTEAAAYFAKDDFATAEKLLKDAVIRYPEQDGGFQGLSALYLSRADNLRRGGKTTEADSALLSALRIAEQQVQQQPNSPGAHFNLGNLSMQFTNYDRAVKSFSRVIELDSKNMAALLNRGIAYLRAGKLDDAQRDYEMLLDRTRTEFRIYFGLAEIAYQKKDWRAARNYYLKYLDFAPADSAETKFVRERLAEVKKKA